jgi:uncharacterized protein (TIGR03382 family)
MAPVLLAATLAPAMARADYALCNADGQCAWPETCGTCPTECGSCDVTTRVDQLAKYVDQACEHAGDGLTDTCAAGAGQTGRFNDLQAAIETLAAGETLFIHPGDYFRAGEPFGSSEEELQGTEEAPIILTAADPANPPTLHSFEPGSGSNDGSHNALALPGAHVIVDHLRIDGAVIVWGTRMQLQYLECTHGWEGCDGNWSCLRAEWCTDCVVHHNWVHDVVDTTAQCTGGDFEPREAGLKEFNGERNIWEFNSVIGAARWGYDLHRNSVDTVVRFNHIQDVGSWGINIERATNSQIYGNILIGTAGCMEVGGLNEQQQGQPHVDSIHHNACLLSTTGYHVGGDIVTSLMDNLAAGVGPGGSEGVNAFLGGPGDTADCNAWDDAAWYSSNLYETYFHSFAEWQNGTDFDAQGIAAPGGACTFVDAPTAPDDVDFDLHLAGAPCATAACDGGEVGPYGITPCVGHACGDVPQAGSGGAGGGPAGSGGSGAGASAAGGSGAAPQASGAGAGAGADPDATDDGGMSSGCACGTAGDDRGTGGALPLLLLGLALGGARRRGRASAR